MPAHWLLLMGIMFLMLWVVTKQGEYRCPYCGAQDKDDHDPGCHWAKYYEDD